MGGFAAGMEVPKAAMDQHNGFVGGEHDVRMAWQGVDMQAETETIGKKEAPHHPFGLGVLALDPRHDAAAGAFVPDIGHGLNFGHKKSPAKCTGQILA